MMIPTEPPYLNPPVFCSKLQSSVGRLCYGCCVTISCAIVVRPFSRVSVYELPWTILSTHLAGVVTVTEEEIITAMKLVSEFV